MILVELNLRGWKHNPTTSTTGYEVVDDTETLKHMVETYKNPHQPVVSRAWTVGSEISLDLTALTVPNQHDKV